MQFCDHHKNVVVERYCVDCRKAICYHCATSSLGGLHSAHRVEHSTDGLATAKLQYVQVLEQCRKLVSNVASCSSNTHNVYNCSCDSTSLEHDCQCSAELTDLNSLIDSIVEMLETTRVNMSTAVLRACQTVHGPARVRSTGQAPHTAPTNGDTIKYTRKQYRTDVEASARADAHTRRHVSGIVNLADSLPNAADLDNHYEVGMVLRKLAAEIAVISNKLKLLPESTERGAAIGATETLTHAQITPTAVAAVAPVKALLSSSAMIQKVPRKTQPNADSEKQLEAMHDKLRNVHQLVRTLKRSSVYLYRNPELVLIAGGQKTQCSGAILRFVPGQTQWTEVSLLLTPRYDHAAATLNNKIIVAGGCRSNSDVLTTVEQFDTRASKVTTLGSLLIGRYRHALISTGGSVYAIGGRNEKNDCLKSVEQYSADNNKWLFCANLVREQCGFAAAACQTNNNIIIAGGQTYENQPSSSCELYNPLEGSTSIASLNIPRIGPVAACLAGSAYVFGGGHRRDNCQTIEQYNFESNTWTLLSQRLFQCRSQFAASCLNDKVYLIGGVPVDTVEIFDSTKHSIEMTTSLPYKLFNLAAAVVSNEEAEMYNESAIYVIGGIGQKACKSLVAIEPTENLRFKLSQMLLPREYAASIVINNKFIVTGGQDSSHIRILNSAEMFDIETKKWTMLPSLNIARFAHTLAVLGDTIYAVGGHFCGELGDEVLNSVEKLEIGKKINKWTKAPDIQHKRSMATCVAIQVSKAMLKYIAY